MATHIAVKQIFCFLFYSVLFFLSFKKKTFPLINLVSTSLTRILKDKKEKTAGG